MPVPEIIDPVFVKTSQNARFLLSENERFGLVFVKTGSINSGTELCIPVDQVLVVHLPLPELCIQVGKVLVFHLPIPELCIPVG
jgi:hypothetical protein